jgi:SAM-dependent methyltransferase
MMAFTFGENWLAYSRTLDAPRLESATRSVAELLGAPDLRGRTVVDVGAGSGLFSLAALKLGAERVVALDRDRNCLKAIEQNAGRYLSAAERARLNVLEADVLDAGRLPHERFDVVYAWGSLHHTGAMWRAVGNVAALCGPQGTFALALYNRTWFTPQWHAIKRAYHAAPAPVRVGMVAALAAPRYALRLVRGRHPSRVERGMSVWYDSIDWLGGLPYEAATCDEVAERLAGLGFSAVRVRATRRHGCNEFVFRRDADV